MKISEFYHILGLLGKASIQQYVVRLGRHYFKLKDMEELSIPKERSNREVIEKGAKVLDKFFELNLVTKEYNSTGDYSQSVIIPLLPLDTLYEKAQKEYTILHNKPKLDLQYTRIGKYSYNIGIKNVLTEFSKSNEEVVNKLSSIPLEVNSSYSIKRRTPKNGKESIDANYRFQTTLFRKVLKEEANNDIYFFWQYDARGRIYPKAYTLNPHGDEWQKVQLQFANKKKVTDRGLVWIKRDIANNFGLDKENHEVKEQWFYENESKLLNLNKSLISKADKKLLLLRGIQAYKDALDDKPIGLPVSLDATSSGIQIMSLLARDKHAGNLTNIGDSLNREDLYLHLGELFLKEIGKEPTKERIHKARNIMKKCGMIYTYNGMKEIEKLLPKEEYRTIFFSLVRQEAKGACEVQDLLNNAFVEAKDLEIMEWTMPDNMAIKVPQITQEYLKVKTRNFNVSFKMDKIGCDFKNNKRSLAVNVIHSIDAYINRQMVLRASGDILPIHDNFQIHPNYCDETLNNYNTILNELSNSDLLGDIVREVTKSQFKNPFLDKTPLNTLKCKYSIC